MTQHEEELIRLQREANEHLAEGNIQLGLLGDQLDKILSAVLALGPTPANNQATTATFRIGDSNMATFTVDETTGTGVVGFEDDKGDTDAPQPVGSTVAFTSDNPSVVSVAADATNPLQADLTVEGVEGSANITASVNDANGNPITEADDGTTAFTQPAPVAVTVSAGQAVSGEFSVASGAAA